MITLGSARVPSAPVTPRRTAWLFEAGAASVLVGLAAVWLVPLAWSAVTALKPERETIQSPPTWWSANFSLAAFRGALGESSLLRWAMNSFLTTTVITVVTVVLASLAAYAFSRLRFPGRTALFWLIVAGIMVPGQVLIVPLFAFVNRLGLVDTYAALILPGLASPLALLVLKTFFDGLPRELEDAAVLDGAGAFRIFWQIWMPLSRPALAAVAIFTFIEAWNSYLWPLIAVTDTNMMTLPVGLATTLDAFGIRNAFNQAQALLAGLPTLVAFLLFQRQIVQGITRTGLHG